MGACLSTADSGESEQKKRSRMIDAKLEEDSRRLRKECKILLLGVFQLSCYKCKGTDDFPGSGESGKSTIVKQMKIIHQNGYTVDELALYRLTIYKNMVDCAKALIGAMRQFQIEPANPQNHEFCEYLMGYQVDADPQKSLDARVGAAVVSFWKDASISQVMEHQSEFYLMDSAP